MPERNRSSRAAGFSLLELLIAMAVTLVMLGIASTLLAQSLNLRTREDRRAEALADAQRALNIMSREIANGGYGYQLGGNGIVAADSNATSIRIRANFNAYPNNPYGAATDNDVADSAYGLDEDVKFMLLTEAAGVKYIVRYNVNTNTSSVLASHIESLAISYLDWAGAATSAASAVKVRISLSVILPQVGMRGAPGFQPASSVQLVSDVAFRNAILITY